MYWKFDRFSSNQHKKDSERGRLRDSSDTEVTILVGMFWDQLHGDRKFPLDIGIADLKLKRDYSQRYMYFLKKATINKRKT